MFKNLIIYRYSGDLSLVELETAIADQAFTPCGLSQERSTGWIPPRGEKHGALLESVAGQWIAKFMVEVKAVPGTVINTRANERADQIEQTEGRKPGKKEMREIKEQILLESLPNAFPRQTACLLWINPQEKLLMVDASTQARADDVVTALVKITEGFSLRLLDTQTTPLAAMSTWLMDANEDRDNLYESHSLLIGRECELKASDESKAVVRYGRHPLDIEEVKTHIQQGKLPTKLGMSYDDRVTFVLTEGMQIKKIALDSAVFADRGADAECGFDADVAIATGELAPLIASLVESLGGEQELPSPFAAPASTAAPAASQDDEPLYDEAVKLVREYGKPSISFIQRHLRISYNHAARLLEQMEKAGLITPMAPDGSREVIA